MWYLSFISRFWRNIYNLYICIYLYICFMYIYIYIRQTFYLLSLWIYMCVCVCVCVFVYGDVWSTEWQQESFAPSTSASPANYHSTECSSSCPIRVDTMGPLVVSYQMDSVPLCPLILSTSSMAAGAMKELTVFQWRCKNSLLAHSTTLKQNRT
jgi:hypothetical protein